MKTDRNSHQRSAVTIGLTVDVIRKEDQGSGKRTRGIVKEILTKSLSHPHGIKVRLAGGTVGRVAAIIGADEPGGGPDKGS
jgi:uncharacterized repeat protein (TIGR03833 family)